MLFLRDIIVHTGRLLSQKNGFKELLAVDFAADRDFILVHFNFRNEIDRANSEIWR